jgi:hypothetical protein
MKSLILALVTITSIARADEDRIGLKFNQVNVAKGIVLDPPLADGTSTKLVIQGKAAADAPTRLIFFGGPNVHNGPCLRQAEAAVNGTSSLLAYFEQGDVLSDTTEEGMRTLRIKRLRGCAIIR